MQIHLLIIAAALLLVAAIVHGCMDDSTDNPTFTGFSDLPTDQGDELWVFCRNGIVYDAFCAGFGEDACPAEWVPVPFLELPATCCRDETGNVFWADADRCEPAWTTVNDGCFSHQPLCNE